MYIIYIHQPNSHVSHPARRRRKRDVRYSAGSASGPVREGGAGGLPRVQSSRRRRARPQNS